MCPPARYARNLQLARRYAPFCGRATRAIPPTRYARPNCASRRHAIPCTAQMFTVVGISWLHVASRDQTPKPPSNPIRRFGLDQLSMVIPCHCIAMEVRIPLNTDESDDFSLRGSIKTFTFVGISWLHVAFRDQSHPAISSGGMVWIS